MRIVLAVILAAGLSIIAQAQNDFSVEVANVRRAYVEAWNAGKVDGVLAFYDRDASFVPPDGTRLQGLDAIREHIQRAMKANPSITINNPQDLALGNSAGYELGNVVGSSEVNGKKQTMQSVYLAVFVHSNQQWLIKAETISVGNAYAAGIPSISKREKLCKLDPAMC